MTKTLVRMAAVIWVAATLGACSVIPDWMGGDSGSSTTADTSDTVAPPADQTTSATDGAGAANNGQFPDLADTPDRPAAPSTTDDQKKVADSLAADRARQNYSADALRAGTEPAAAPPGAAPPLRFLAAKRRNGAAASRRDNWRSTLAMRERTRPAARQSVPRRDRGPG